MQESRQTTVVERVLGVVFSSKILLGLSLPFATVFFRGCTVAVEKPKETYTGWTLMVENFDLAFVPLMAAIALACALFNRRLRNVLFAIFWNSVKLVFATYALASVGIGMLGGYHGSDAEPMIGFWITLAGASGIFVLWWFGLLANWGPFRAFWKERKIGKVHGKLLTSVIIGDWVFGLAFPAAAVAVTIWFVIEMTSWDVWPLTYLAWWLLWGVELFVLFFTLKLGLRRGQKWAALFQVAVAAGMIALVASFLPVPDPSEKVGYIILGCAVAAWFLYTVVAIVLTRRTFTTTRSSPV